MYNLWGKREIRWTRPISLFFLHFIEKKVVKMFGTLEKMYYFCGVQEQIIAFEGNETFLKLFTQMLAYMKSFSYLCIVNDNEYGTWS